MNNLEKLLAIAAHISYLFFGIGFLILPVIIYIFAIDRNKLLENHALEAVKAQGVLLLIGIVLIILSLLTFSAAAMPLFTMYFLLIICYIPFSIYAGYKALIDEEYQYPRL